MSSYLKKRELGLRAIGLRIGEKVLEADEQIEFASADDAALEHAGEMRLVFNWMCEEGRLGAFSFRLHICGEPK